MSSLFADINTSTSTVITKEMLAAAYERMRAEDFQPKRVFPEPLHPKDFDALVESGHLNSDGRIIWEAWR